MARRAKAIGWQGCTALAWAWGMSACMQPIKESDSGATAAADIAAPDAASAETVLRAADTAQAPPTDAAADPDVGCDPPCDPWSTCTAGSCAAKPCSADKQCNADPLPPDTAKHWCYKGKCAAFQCGKDADCPAGQLCNTLLYECYDTPKGCSSAKQCDDADICTTDACELGGQCSHKAVPGCCHNDFGCDDGKACTKDTCKNNACEWLAGGQCCSDGKECNDGNACTQDLCQGGICAHPAAPGCCKSAAECDDLDPASADSCLNGNCTHVWNGLAAQCPGGACTQNACVKGTCSNGACSYAKPSGPNCCTADSQCLQDGVCQIAACASAMCALQPVKNATGPYARYRFDVAALDSWTVEKSSPSVYFHYSTLSQISGAGALRYGVPGKVTFEDSTANKGAASSPAFKMPTAPSIRFWTLLDVEPGTAVHQCGIDVMDAATGAKLATVWSKNQQLGSGTTSAKWLQQEAPLPATLAGKQVKLRAWFDQLKYDTSNKDKLGWIVDELEVLGFCP